MAALGTPPAFETVQPSVHDGVDYNGVDGIDVGGLHVVDGIDVGGLAVFDGHAADDIIVDGLAAVIVDGSGPTEETAMEALAVETLSDAEFETRAWWSSINSIWGWGLLVYVINWVVGRYFQTKPRALYDTSFDLFNMAICFGLMFAMGVMWCISCSKKASSSQVKNHTRYLALFLTLGITVVLQWVVNLEYFFKQVNLRTYIITFNNIFSFGMLVFIMPLGLMTQRERKQSL